MTVRQIVHRIGRRPVCKLLRIGKWAPLKWYEAGIPGRHWPKLVNNIEWLSYDMLETANMIAQRGTRKAA